MKLTQWSLLLLLLPGCVSTSNYQQEGKSARATEQDLIICEDKVLKEHRVTASTKEREALMDECMKDKGYQLKPR
jgi:hypothetical protein